MNEKLKLHPHQLRRGAFYIGLITLAGWFESQPLSLMYGISISFGTLVLLASVRIFRLRYVAAGSLLVYAASILLFHQPEYLAVHIPEILIVGYLSVMRKNKSLFLWDALFWLLFAPFGAFMLYLWNYPTYEVFLILLVGITNSLLSATIAGIVAHYLPDWLRISARRGQSIPLKDALVHFTLMVVIGSYLLYMWIGNINYSDSLERNTRQQSANVASSIREDLTQLDKGDVPFTKLSSRIRIGYLQEMIAKYTSEGLFFITITDQQNRIVADSFEANYGSDYHIETADVAKQLSPNFLLLLPRIEEGELSRRPWEKASYLFVQELPSLSLKLYIETPLRPYLAAVYEHYLYHFLNLAVCVLGVMALAMIFSRKLTRTITRLSLSTADLPDRLKRMESIQWPDSRIIEFHSLTNNFKHMSDNLQRLFQQSLDTNAKLQEQTVKLLASEVKLQQLAYYDHLTGLPNRLRFIQHLEQSLDEHAEGDLVAVMFADLNRFKQINDTLGHAAGDQLLQQVAVRFSRCISAQCSVFRLGGDEFVFALHAQHEDELHQYAERICRLFDEPILFPDTELFISVSLGISVYPRDSQDKDALLKHADMAMYQAKELGTSGYRFFNQTMHMYFEEKLQLENGLRSALINGEFTLNYQPKAATATGQISGAEALIRWKHPQLGMIPPDRFIPLAETSGMILEIDAWVFREACRQSRAWQERGMTPMPVSVNISAKHFEHGNLAEMIQLGLQETGMEPSLITLELTEGIFIKNHAKVIRQLQEIRNCGVRISIDDFGTGYSSLNLLQQLPIDEVKLDRSFIQGMAQDPRKSRIVRAIVELMHSLQQHVVAEGIETEEDFQYFRQLKCDEIQGYWFSRPLPPADFETFVESRCPRKTREVR